MAGMLASPKNRSVNKVDNPYDSDGFYMYRHFKRPRKTGAATGNRDRRRTLRTKEKVATRNLIREEMAA